MNELEKALHSASNDDLDLYFEVTSTTKIRNDINDIKRKASDESDATAKLAEIIRIING